MAVKIFRWKAIGPLALVLAIIGVLLWLFAEPVAKDTAEEVSTELLGTQVDIGKLDIIADEASVDLRALQIADPFDPNRNLVEASEIRLKLNPVALAEKKFVVENFRLGGMRFGTGREKPARPVEGDGFAPQALRAVRQWSQQFDVPILKLTPIDTIKQLVLNPTQLTTVRSAQALATRADSARRGLDQSFQQLDIKGTVDTARGLAERLRATNPRKLGLDGTRKALEDARATLKRLEDAKKRLDALERQVKGGVGTLTSGLAALDEARKKDYAFAKSLLQLPSFSAPEIGEAFFGKVSIDRFQQALYYSELARHYMPPGLLPKADEGPQRLRASGKSIRFPKEKEWPKFLVQTGQMDLAIGGDSPLRGAYEAVVQGLTSDPSLYGKPTVVRTSRTAKGSAIASIDVRAVIDHVRPGRVKDSASARLRGVKLPSFTVPGLQFNLQPGTGSADPERTVFGPVVDRLQPGRLGPRQHREEAQHPGAARVARGLRTQAAVGGRPGQWLGALAQARGVEQPRPRHRGAAPGGHRRGGGQGGEDGPGQGGQPRGRQGGAGEAAGLRCPDPGGDTARDGAEAAGRCGAGAPGGGQAAHGRAGARHRAAEDQAVRSARAELPARLSS
jgi:uncharacterized protein (TIGR03545 family)